MNVTPDTREPLRMTPTMREQHAIDLYAEGYSHPSIQVETGIARTDQHRIFVRYGIPVRTYPNASDRPRLMTDAEMLRGGELTDAHLAVSERRTRDTEREVAETMQRINGLKRAA
jgi:hypothetical protein